LINIGSKHDDVDSMFSAKVGKSQDMGESKIRSLALLEENPAYVSELIPSWQGPVKAPEGSMIRHRTEMDENDSRQVPNQALTELRKALRELGGKKMQRETGLNTISKPSSPMVKVQEKPSSHRRSYCFFGYN
jgi:hypothetical protein